MFEMLWPWALALLPLPWLVWRSLPRAAEQQEAALRVPCIDDFSSAAAVASRGAASLGVKLLLILCWLLLVLATTRPQWVGDPLELPVSGRDLMLAVDLSGSMEIADFEVLGRRVDRLSATKVVAREFIERRKGDRLGLILFGEQAYLQTPLTFDLQTVNTLLMEAAIGLAGKATAIGDAIGLAIKRLKDNPRSNRVLILLTDGANTAGEIAPIKAAELAAGHDLKIYTIGIGADEMVQQTLFGQRTVNPSADLDEDTLIAIAEKTGGRYFRARDTDELEKIYAELNRLEPVEVEHQTFRPVKALYMWPLGAALVLGMLLWLGRLLGSGVR